MGKASAEAKNRWNAKNYDRIGVMVPKGHKEEIATHGESINGFIGRAITETAGLSRRHSFSYKRTIRHTEFLAHKRTKTTVSG